MSAGWRERRGRDEGREVRDGRMEGRMDGGGRKGETEGNVLTERLRDAPVCVGSARSGSSRSGSSVELRLRCPLALRRCSLPAEARPLR